MTAPHRANCCRRTCRCGQGFQRDPLARLRDDGRPAGDPERDGISISCDDEQAKRTVAELIDQIGFDPVDAGALAEGWTQASTGRPADTNPLRTEEFHARLLA